MPSPASATNNCILIRATNWIGDSVMMMPAVTRLREANPQAHIVLLCPARLRDLWRYNPHIDEVITELTGRFDTAYIFPNSFRSAWETWRAHIPRRIGYPGHWRRRLLSDIIPDNETIHYESITIAGTAFRRKVFNSQRHQVHRHLALVGSSQPTPPRIWLGPDEAAIRAKLLGDDPRPILALNPGAEFGPAKRWPAERFAEVATRAANCRVVLLGGPRDPLIPLPERSLNLVGKTSLLALCVVLRAARVLLTNDTGPMHLAAALDVPQVCIFGSTSPELTGPLSDKAVVLRQRVECSPCFLRECPMDFRCMTRLGVEEVAAAVLRLLQSS
ncbi:MAG: lipopolysaccharide heptosyltransferase II [Verrucomicrobia bacterium]|nr:lipopolysaccharide heptosyltransferase II [Verrucomicrobiota bacterium]